ncbi:ABC transporter substrate-binding protein [Staphylococcus devriesei]|uniref:ABC transporter substrate-binding protein n=1 Tax=Staphylococcus devriesei TaxID=586733 RepID=A0A2T4KPY5_9STAP|nr:oligopeptide ABC transporter substrate-binding protein [Staphylococcus devriesei]MCE5089304.1 ABC transporter substrate-binding protein [Staphylococcus devriesei]PTE71068.1 ABC transporter substrate-binding protein [Staphylococcus devriesei]PTF04392.1 ABC transporter substrate-binding protein [Staphylococcus devriesei]PTF13372.1 ABC transporter substrate-binding protein [Staphylococcus devriesei]RIL73407.1 ABC transporter substrate-binding protein [Staphylococcus devriesei]
MKILMKYLILVLVATLVLSACGKNGGGSLDKATSKTETSNHKGGEMNIALGAPPSGTFSTLLSSDASDANVEGYFNESLIKIDKNMKLKPYIASWKDIDPAKKVRFTIKKGIKWQDGNELTVDDWIYSLNVLADKDYEGSYYPIVENIEGAPQKHAGQADTINGLKKIDNYTMDVTFKEKKVNYLEGFFAGPLLSKKYLSDVPIKDLAKSDKIRKHPIGIGPYKVTKVAQGEAVQLKKFKDYWQGEPALDKINLKVIDQTQIVKAMKNGEIDMADQATGTIAQEAKKSGDGKLKVLSAPGLDYSILGFVSHDYDKDKNKTGAERPKYKEKKLRQAMLYAIDRKKWIKAFYQGYGKELNSLVPSIHWIAADQKDLNSYEYSPEKAKKLLDELGYKDRNGDGFREDPNGKPFEINLKQYSGSNPTFEPRTAAIKDFWEKVGLKTNMKLVEFGKYNDDLAKASKNMEVYFRTWAGATDPDPSDSYHSDRPQNEMRTVDKISDKYLDDALDFNKVGTDDKKRKDIYVKWQKHVNETLPALPIVQLDSIAIVSDKVRNYDLQMGSDLDLYKLTKE